MSMNFYRSDGWVKTSQGPAVSGAQIWVCLQPANVQPPITPPRTLPVPWSGPNPQAQIYSDAGLTPITQPIITDGFGHYDFYALPGVYTVVVLFGGKMQQFYIDQSVGLAGSSGASLLLSTNGTPNFNQTALNFVQGSGITLATDNFGNMTITGSTPPPPATGLTLQTNEVPNVSQTLLDLHAGTGVSLVDNGSGRVTVTNTAPAPVVNNQFGYSSWGALRVSCGATGSSIVGIGIISGWTLANTSTTALQSPTATEPWMMQYNGQTGASATTSFAYGAQADCTIGVMRRVGWRVKINQNSSNVRYWIVETENISVAMYSNTPAESVFGFRYSSTSAGDTYWMCYAGVGSGGGQFSAISSGVLPDTTASHYFEVQRDGAGGLNYYIDNNLVGNIPAGTPIPSATKQLYAAVCVDNNNTANTRSFQLASWYLENVR